MTEINKHTNYINPALAWSLENGGKGYFVITFPFTLDSGWYREQPCTTFRIFQHRKEREGRIRHEFIVLKLSNGSVCRVERMGDPNARLNALATQGSIAQDLAQCFPSESEAHLESSEVISEVTLPCEFEIQDVLKICRAIKEGEKTRNYTLQVYNCYFFSLAIQACLTRFIAYWENGEHFAEWLLRANEAVEELTRTDQAHASSGSSPHYHVLFKILSNPSLCNNQEPSLIMSIQANLQGLMARSSMIRQDLEYRVNNLLWYSTIGSSLDEFVEENAIEAVLNTLEKRFSEITTTSGSFEPLEEPNSQLPSILTCLVARAGGIEWPKSHALALNKLKQKQIYQLGAGLSILKEDIRLDSHTPAVPTAGPLINWPWAIGLVRYLVAYLLWVLHFVLLSLSGMMLLEISGTPTIAIEKWLDDMATKSEHSGTIKCTASEWIIQDIHALLKDQRAIWDKSPWNSIYVSIKDYMHARANILEYLEESKPTIGVRFGDAKTELNIYVSSFQEHIIKRIKMQAKEVESVWLGSSAKIQVELKETLSQVWRMIREDAGITEKVVQINHRLVQKLELLSVQHLEAQVASWREHLPNLESRVQELSDVGFRPDAHPEAMVEYAQAKQELDQTKVLFAKAQEILNDKQLQAAQAQAVNVDGPSRQNIIPRDRTTFLHLFRLWFAQSGRNSGAIPQIGEKPLDLYQLYIEVETLGGPERLQAAGLWRLVAIKMGYITHEQIDSQLAQIAKVLANAYATLLVPFDSFCLDRMRRQELHQLNQQEQLVQAHRQQQQHIQQPYVNDLSGGVQIRPQENQVLEPRPRQRYSPYRKPHDLTWLHALNNWAAKSKPTPKLSWIEGFKREEGNKATHIMTPVLTCILYEYPDESVQMHLRRTGGALSDAIEEAKSVVRSRLDGKVLVDFCGRAEDNGIEGSHCRYKIVDINYTYWLDDCPITECQSEGDSKRHAQQKAAKLLLESERYCMSVIGR